MDPDNDDYHLDPSAPSPCWDAGSDSYYVAGDLDLDGNDRKQGAHVDMGAYEVPEPTCLALLGMGFGGLMLRRRR